MSKAKQLVYKVFVVHAHCVSLALPPVCGVSLLGHRNYYRRSTRQTLPAFTWAYAKRTPSDGCRRGFAALSVKMRWVYRRLLTRRSRALPAA